MILTTDSERADPKILRYVFFINILQRFHRKFLSGNQRKILITSGINGLKKEARSWQSLGEGESMNEKRSYLLLGSRRLKYNRSFCDLFLVRGQ